MIAREHIVISHIVDDELGDMAIAWLDHSGDVDRLPVGTRIWIGETDYEAAMLCYGSACFDEALPVCTENPAPNAPRSWRA